MTCVLCLCELIFNFSDVSSEEIISLIEKYFWFKPSQHQKICADCWNSLISFHNFYQKIQNVHNKFAQLPKPEPEDIDSAEVKIEMETNEIQQLSEKLVEVDELLSIQTRKKRGRTCSNPISVKNCIEESNESKMSFVRKCASSAEEKDVKKRTNSSDENNPTNSPKRKQNKEVAYSESTDEDEMNEVRQKDMSANYKLSKVYDEFLEKNWKFSCSICSASVDNFLEIKRHFRSIHKVRGYVLCCGKKFLKRGVLVDHIHTHIDPNYFKCTKCDKVMAARRCLKIHLTSHEIVKERKHQCNDCGKTFFQKVLLKRHMLTHIPEEECQFKCSKCNKSFASNYTMKQHINNVHVKAYAKICDICGKSIRGRELFQRHLLEHSGVSLPSVQCNQCGTNFTNKYGLTRHIKAMHVEENIQPQICEICKKVSPNLSAHRRHMNYVHSLKRSHQCPLCDKAFKRAKALKEHMAIHTGEQLYTCPHCPKTFNSNANLHSHRKKIHRLEWEENRLKRKRMPVEDKTITKDDETVIDKPEIDVI